jgi:hypothetical protein
MDSPRAWSRLSYTVLAQDPRFRDIPVAVIGEAPPDFANALRNIDQVAADPRRPDGVPLVRMRAFEGRLKRMLNTLPGVLTDTVLCQSILFCWRFQLSAAQAVLSNIYQYRP